MEDLSFAHRSDHEPARSFDAAADVGTESRASRSVSNLAPAYRAASALDDLSAYAAVFDCTAGCTMANA